MISLKYFLMQHPILINLINKKQHKSIQSNDSNKICIKLKAAKNNLPPPPRTAAAVQHNGV
jgi:hypothetical protein